MNKFEVIRKDKGVERIARFACYDSQAAVIAVHFIRGILNSSYT